MNSKENFEYSPPETNFVERLQYWALAKPETDAFRFLEGGEIDQVAKLSYSELDEKARSIAAQLVSAGYTGQRALMMYPPGLEFVAAFFGCHYAGVIPVPAYPPRRNRNMTRINAINEDSQAAVTLTVKSVMEKQRQQDPQSNYNWLTTEDIPLEIASDWVPTKLTDNSLGLIQYTSGSTGSPKGVMLTHQNLIANARMITHAFSLNFEVAEAVSWLPLYHDMGLIGGCLTAAYNGICNTIMSPIAFLTKPIRWLRAISEFQAVCSGGPNFAYALCNDKVTPEQCEGLDLSSWEVAYNGAEPVRADVMDEFTRKFAPYGFRPEAHYPCYGMAETTLLVTGGDAKSEPIIRTFDQSALVEHRVSHVEPSHENAKNLVGCGQVVPPEEVLIVNPETRRPLPDDQIGEIWVDSPSAGTGYWNKEEISEEIFRARLSPDNGKTYLRTGDLGFMDRGELFVSGRLKDMIIIRGVNRYPQDIEATAESCDYRTRNGGTAAFAFERWDREHLVVVCEVKRSRDHKSWNDLIETIRSQVTSEHDLPPDAIVLVRAHSVPKTSSGKVQRHACREDFKNDRLLTVAKWISWEDNGGVEVASENSSVLTNGHVSEKGYTAEELTLHGLFPQVVDAVIHFVKQAGRERTKNVGLETNIVELGLDSLERMEIASNVQVAFGGTIPEDVLQETETIKDVALAVQQHIGNQPVVDDFTSLDAQTGGGAARISGPIPESYYQLEKMPEFVRLQRQKAVFKENGLRNPFFSVHEGNINSTTHIGGRELISFASYNYLGLSGTEAVSKVAKDAIDEFGTSVSASRIVSGEKTIHRELENELSEFLGVQDVITFPGGHACNESVVGHLVGPGDLILHDSFAHNSIVQGAILSGARRRAFNHNSWSHLDEILQEIRNDYRRVLIAIEGLYSMDGDYPDLPKFIEVKKRHKAWLYVDEAHSIGTLGETGRGVAEIYGVRREDAECWMGTLSKSFGSCGGFVGGQQELIEYLRYTTPGYVFAAGMPPANVGAALGALRQIKEDNRRVQKLQANSALFLSLATDAGLNTGDSMGGAPIIPIITGSSNLALLLSQRLFDEGINAQPILYPAVPENQTRVRIFMTACHSEEQIRFSVETLSRLWDEIKGGLTVVPVLSE